MEIIGRDGEGTRGEGLPPDRRLTFSASPFRGMPARMSLAIQIAGMRFLSAAALVVPLLAVACGGQSASTTGEQASGISTVAVAETETGDGASAPAPRKSPAPSRKNRSREDLNRTDMAAARAAVKLGPAFYPGWSETAATPDNGSDCTTFNPDLSRFTITGKARSAMKTESGARIEYSIKIYANSAQARRVFRVSTGPRDLRCIRDGVAGDLREAGFTVPVIQARQLREPRVGTDTIIYALYYELELPDVEERQPYPIEVFVFRTGRVVGAAFFTFIADKEAELRHVYRLEARVHGI